MTTGGKISLYVRSSINPTLASSLGLPISMILSPASKLKSGGLRLETCGWRPDAGVLGLEAWDWRPGTGGLWLEACGWRPI